MLFYVSTLLEILVRSDSVGYGIIVDYDVSTLLEILGLRPSRGVHKAVRIVSTLLEILDVSSLS